MTVDCDCDDGVRDNGICPDCGGVGWYIELSFIELEAWIGAETN